MGNGIAHVFAQHGWSVTLVDVAQDALARGLATIKKNVERLEKKGVIGHQLSVDMLGRIQTNTALDAVKDAALVVEAATENPTPSSTSSKSWTVWLPKARSSRPTPRRYRSRK